MDLAEAALSRALRMTSSVDAEGAGAGRAGVAGPFERDASRSDLLGRGGGGRGALRDCDAVVAWLCGARSSHANQSPGSLRIASSTPEVLYHSSMAMISRSVMGVSMVYSFRDLA